MSNRLYLSSIILTLYPYSYKVHAGLFVTETAAPSTSMQENAVLMPAGAGRRLVLVDFGKSKPVGRRITASSGYGTSAYTAPETVADDCDSAQCWAPPLDMWSLGILLVVLLTKHYPWKVSHPSYDRRYAAWASNHGKGEFGPVARALLELGFVGPDCLDFLVRLLDPDPATRMTLAGAAAHKWCTDG